MTRRAKTHSTGCTIAFAADIFGDRWTLLVLRDLMFHRKSRFGEFLASPESIASNILSDRLARLEDRGIVTRERDPDNHRSWIYRLTPLGLSMAPILFEIVKWSSPQLDLNATRQALYDRIVTEPNAIMDEIREQAAPPAPRAP